MCEVIHDAIRRLMILLYPLRRNRTPLAVEMLAGPSRQSPQQGLKEVTSLLLMASGAGVTRELFNYMILSNYMQLYIYMIYTLILTSCGRVRLPSPSYEDQLRPAKELIDSARAFKIRRRSCQWHFPAKQL